MVSPPLLAWLEHWQRQGVSPLPRAFAIRRVGQVSSTNSLLWKQFPQPTTPSQPVPVIIAQSQSQGRGQWGRQWNSAPGGLYLSTGLPPLSVPAGALMVACAWGIAAALRQFNLPICLKWPNDLVIGTQKLGGMLVETRLSGTQVRRALLGVGINWHNQPPDNGIAIADLSDAHPQIRTSQDTLVAAVLSGIAIGCGRLQVQGAVAIPPAYGELMTHRGQSIPFDYRGKRCLGQIEGIAPTGQLRMRLNAPHPKGHRDNLSAIVTVDVGQVNLSYESATAVGPPPRDR